MKVLIADNSPTMLKQLSDLLDNEGYDVIQCANGVEALDYYNKDKPDFLCLDINMDDISGYDVCKEIRKTDQLTPIIFISGKSETLDKVLGLELGADDYIVKPIDIHEVKARIRAISRRCMAVQHADKESEFFRLDDLKVYPSQFRAYRGNDVIELNLRDLKILKLLYKHTNEVVDRNLLLDECWGRHIMPESRTVDWHIAKLRKLVEVDPKEPKIIKTVHGVGYRYDKN